MKRSHLFAYYSSLLVPVGALLGLGAGELFGRPVLWTALGIVLGGWGAALWLRWTVAGGGRR